MYVLFQFEADGTKNKEFNTTLDHNTNILAYLTTKIEKDGLIEDVKSLDSQLGLFNKEEPTTDKAEDVKEEDNSEDNQEETVEETVEETSEKQEDK